MEERRPRTDAGSGVRYELSLVKFAHLLVSMPLATTQRLQEACHHNLYTCALTEQVLPSKDVRLVNGRVILAASAVEFLLQEGYQGLFALSIKDAHSVLREFQAIPPAEHQAELSRLACTEAAPIPERAFLAELLNDSLLRQQEVAALNVPSPEDIPYTRDEAERYLAWVHHHMRWFRLRELQGIPLDGQDRRKYDAHAQAAIRMEVILPLIPWRRADH